MSEVEAEVDGSLYITKDSFDCRKIILSRSMQELADQIDNIREAPTKERYKVGSLKGELRKRGPHQWQMVWRRVWNQALWHDPIYPEHIWIDQQIYLWMCTRHLDRESN